MKAFFKRISIGLLGSLSLLSGCDNKEAPEPNQLQAHLTLELLDALTHKEHDVAVNKLEKLEDLDKRNLFIPKFKNIEKTNVVLVNAQAEVDAGRPEEALKIVDKAIHLLGPFENLKSAKSELEVIVSTNKLLEQLKQKPRCSSEIFAKLKRFRAIGKNSSYARKFEPFLKRKERVAVALDIWEKKEAVIDLELDLLGFELQKKALDKVEFNTLFTMLAELSLENKDISVNKHINYILKKKRKDY